MLNNYGPRYALVRSTLAGASFLTFIGLSLQLLKQQEGDDRIMLLEGIDLTIFSRTLLFALFVFQSANVQFLYTQHWSFLGSILTPEEGKVWFAPIAGIGSITSTIAASQVSHLVEKIGLIGLLCTAALVIGSSAIFADAAYKVATEVSQSLRLYVWYQIHQFHLVFFILYSTFNIQHSTHIRTCGLLYVGSNLGRMNRINSTGLNLHTMQRRNKKKTSRPMKNK